MPPQFGEWHSELTDLSRQTQINCKLNREIKLTTTWTTLENRIFFLRINPKHTVHLALLLSLNIVGCATSQKTDISPRILNGCQGEGCDCTHEKQTNENFVLYEKMDVGSNKIGEFGSGTSANPLGSYIVVHNPGRHKVISVDSDLLKLKKVRLDLKPGDEITHLIYLGEGRYNARKSGFEIDFDSEDVVIEEMEMMWSDQWFHLEVGSKKGYSRIFPFLRCSE